ncbi:MAG: O-antigen ligase family protein [Candidatus Omnitrophota bacterium]|nr:O-antigen ligase family protein [Candidatus Omnitrophota bacterium]
MRVIVTLIITFVGILASFFNAIYGLIAYAFWSYTHPENVTWGLLPMGRLSYAVGLTLVITTVLQKKKLFSGNPKVVFIIMFWILCLIGVVTAGSTELSSWQFQYFTRVIMITLIMTVLIDDIKKFKYYIWAMVIFIGLVAAQSGIRGTLIGEVGGAESGFAGVLGERNFTAVFLCSIIPIVFYSGNAEKSKKLKLLLRGILLGDILALILTYSRAGFLGMAATGLFAFIKAKRKILTGMTSFVILFILINFFIPHEYIDRLHTMKKVDIKQEDVDMSAAARLIAWRSAIEMIKDRPLTGVGFYNAEAAIGDYQDPETGISLAGLAIHNTLLQVGAELGLPALILYIFLFFIIYRTLGRIRRKVRLNKLNEEMSKYALMLQISFVGFFVSAFFVNAAFIDISWHLAGLTIALEQIVNKELEQPAPQTG